MSDLACVIFAGGKSSRMGSDKALLPFGGYSSLTHFQHQRLFGFFSHIYISTKTADKFDFKANFILDPQEVDFAPTAGFINTFETLKCERFFAISVDSPFVGYDEITAIINADHPDMDATIAKTPAGIHPLCGIYHRSLYEQFLRMQEHKDHRLGKLLTHSKTTYVEFDNDDLFANLNHPHEYQEALSRYNMILHTP